MWESRRRSARSSSVACAWDRPPSPSPPRVQFRRTAWSAASEVTFARPSSQERASTTSTPRAESSSARARTARPPALAGDASSSSISRARRVRGRVVLPSMGKSPCRRSGGSEGVGQIEHPVLEAVRAVEGLLHGQPRVAVGGDDAEREVVVELPVAVGVDLEHHVAGRDVGAEGLRVVELEQVPDHPGADPVGRGQVHADHVADQVGVGEEVLAGDLALPPGAPVVEAGEQRVERLAPRGLRIVPLEEGVAVGELRLPGDAGELVGRLGRPRVGEQQVAVLLAGVLELERQVGEPREGGRVGAGVEHPEPVAQRLLGGVRADVEVRHAEGRGLAERELVVGAPDLGPGVALRHLVAVEVEHLEGVGAGLEAHHSGDLPGLAGVGPEAAAAAPLPGAVPQQHAVADLVGRAPAVDLEQVLRLAQRGARAPPEVEVLDLERRGLLADDLRGGRAERALADRAELPVELALTRVVGHREGGLDVALQPVGAEVARRVRTDVGVEGVAEAEVAGAGVEVERPVERLRQPRGALLRLGRGGGRRLRNRRLLLGGEADGTERGDRGYAEQESATADVESFHAPRVTRCGGSRLLDLGCRVVGPSPRGLARILLIRVVSVGVFVSTLIPARSWKTPGRASGGDEMPAKYVYAFGGGSAEGDGAQKNLLGGKGAGLAEMSRLGIPVPPGFTITTEVCTFYQDHDGSYPGSLESEVAEQLARLETQAGQRFGDPQNPLLVSVRSGAARSMPGMMDTILNLGLSEEVVAAWIGPGEDARFVLDAYRRLLTMYGDVVMEVPHAEFEKILGNARRSQGAANDAELTAESLRKVADGFKELIERRCGKPFPQEPREQLWGAIGA